MSETMEEGNIAETTETNNPSIGDVKIAETTLTNNPSIEDGKVANTSESLQDGKIAEILSAESRPSRQRKVVQHFQASIETDKKELVVQNGSGIKLGDYEYFNKQLEKISGDSDVIKSLYSIMFNKIGKKIETKKHLRLFSGFEGENTQKEKLGKVLENKKKWTISLLKEALSLFGLEKGGTRDELANRLMDYIGKPEILKSLAEAESSKTSGKRKRISSSSKGKGKSNTKQKKDKKKKSPTAYMLFSQSIRVQTKEENPELDFGSFNKLLGGKWNALDSSAKDVCIERVFLICILCLY